MRTVHPANKLIALLALGISVGGLHAVPLYALAFCLISAVACYCMNAFLQTIKRLKWLFTTLFLVYAYTTPGQYLDTLPLSIAPTFEGLQQGGEQIARLMVMLAALSMIQHTTGREPFIVGVYCLLKPLRRLGFQPERLAIRIWLTLQYADVSNRMRSAPVDTDAQTTRMSILEVLRTKFDEASSIEFERYPAIQLNYPFWQIKDSILLGLILTGVVLLRCV